MPSTYTVGWDAAGVAGDFSTWAAALAAAGEGDTLIARFANNAGRRSWDVATIAPTVSLTFQGLDLDGSSQITFGDITGSGVCFTPPASKTTVFSNLAFVNQGYANVSYAIRPLANSATITADRCLFYGFTSGITNLTRLTTTILATNCITIGCYIGYYLHTGEAGTTYTCINCTALDSWIGYYRNASGVMVVKNCLGMHSSYNGGTEYLGTFDAASTNNSSMDGTAPNTGEVPVTPATAKMWCDLNANLWTKDPRVTTASVLHGAGVTGTGVTTDFFGRTRAAAPTIGACEGWDIPTHPAAANVQTGTGTFIDLTGATITPSLVAATSAGFVG